MHAHTHTHISTFPSQMCQIKSVICVLTNSPSHRKFLLPIIPSPSHQMSIKRTKFSNNHCFIQLVVLIS